MSREKYQSKSAVRLLTALLSLGLAAGLWTGCSKDDGEADDEGDAVSMADGTGGDGIDDPDADGEDPDGDSSDKDTGTTEQDTGPPGAEVSAKSFGVLPPIAASCDKPNKRQRIPFYFTARVGNDLRPIKEGDLFGGTVIRPNGTIGAGVLTTRRTRVSEISQNTCKTSSQCKMPLKCGASGVRGADRYCTRQTGIEFIPGTTKQDFRPNFDEDSGQVVALLLENTAMYEGLLPTPVNGQYDENGKQDLFAKKGRATDPNLKNREAIQKFSTFLATAADPANTKVTFWYFGGEFRANARPALNSMEMKDHFTDDLQLPKDLANEANMPSPAPKPSNVYQSILQVIDRDLGIQKYKNDEKFLFVVTDGPNEVWDENATKTKVLSKLKEHDIHLFMMHLDSKVDSSLLRDVPTYWQGNSNCQKDESCDGAPPCSQDSDCENFETCRKATIYAEKMGGSVKETPVKYCLPDYSSGQLGPIDDYADMACETNGNYIYAASPDQLVHYARQLPFLIDGQWSVEAEISALDKEVGLPGGYYKLSGVFFGLLNPNLSSTMSATSSSGQIQHPTDTRGLIRLAD